MSSDVADQNSPLENSLYETGKYKISNEVL